LTPQEFIEELVGKNWEEWHLPVLLDHVKDSLECAERYRFVRDFAKKLSFNDNPRDRSEYNSFDDLVDAKRYDTDEDYT
jgi:hypothetical protein